MHTTNKHGYILKNHIHRINKPVNNMLDDNFAQKINKPVNNTLDDNFAQKVGLSCNRGKLDLKMYN